MTRQSGDSPSRQQDVTQLLRAWSEGDSGALQQLTPLVYEELYRRAHWHMARENPGHTLQATALVNEIYVRMVDLRGVSWRDLTARPAPGPSDRRRRLREHTP